MKSYKVLVNRFGGWYVSDFGLNKLAAEAIRDYYLDRGIDACIAEE